MKQEMLKDKKVVIIGGSAGIGLATAKAAGEAGARVVIASGSQSRIDAALKELPKESEGYVVNVRDEEQIKKLFNKTGVFDHLVYTAGEPIKVSEVKDTLLDEAKQYFNIRYWGAFMAVKYGASQLNKNGSITLTSGIASQRPGKGWALGASICSAMEGFAKALAIELAPVRVNIVSPGIVRTDLWSGLSQPDRDGMYQFYANALPVKFVGEPHDIAKTYLYLMTQSYSTGQTVIVDGGGVLV
jgi:NAD(P)-dependent dehydrogenase (short-subunit alcohol dehydrogenase family)